MGERKVLNKYYPPDFDPSKLPKGKRPRDEQMKVRMMLPMSVRCNTCGNFMYKGTKFNTRMENVETENYLGIKVFRFYWRCTGCAAEFTIKTDPKNSDYTMENGATRNYEPWRAQDAAKVQTAQEREEEERGNAMKVLENRTKESKQEMDIIQALDEQQSLNARHAQVTPEQALAALKRTAAEQPDELDPDDEEVVKQLLAQQASFVRRIASDPSKRPKSDPSSGPAAQPASSGPQSDAQAAAAESQPAVARTGQATSAPQPAQPARLKPAVVIKRKAAPVAAAAAPAATTVTAEKHVDAPNLPANGSNAVNSAQDGKADDSPAGGLLGLGQYSDSDDSKSQT